MNVIMDGIILIIQAIILMGQLALSWKIHQQAISRDKGFFVIEKSNYITLPEVNERFERKFDLTNDDGIVSHGLLHMPVSHIFHIPAGFSRSRTFPFSGSYQACRFLETPAP